MSFPEGIAMSFHRLGTLGGLHTSEPKGRCSWDLVAVVTVGPSGSGPGTKLQEVVGISDRWQEVEGSLLTAAGYTAGIFCRLF